MDAHTTKVPQTVLTPAFLIWCERFTGEFLLEGEEYEVTRDLDGWLICRRDDGRRVPIPWNLLVATTLTRTRTLAERDALLRGLEGSSEEVDAECRRPARWLLPSEQKRLDYMSSEPDATRLREAVVRRRVIESIEERERLAQLATWKEARLLGGIHHSAHDMALIDALQRYCKLPDPYPIPPAFLLRARRFHETCHEPLLEYRHGHYRTVFSAFETAFGFDLTVENCQAALEPWRCYARWRGIDVERARRPNGPGGKHAPLPTDGASNSYWSPTRPVAERIGMLPRSFMSSGWVGTNPRITIEQSEHNEVLDGVVRATSIPALVCLQYMLDDLEGGVCIRLPSRT